jgi:hypothetical protein
MKPVADVGNDGFQADITEAGIPDDLDLTAIPAGTESYFEIRFTPAADGGLGCTVTFQPGALAPLVLGSGPLDGTCQAGSPAAITAPVSLPAKPSRHHTVAPPTGATS